MKEHKTCSNWPEEKFDAEVNALVSDGWTVDSKAFGCNDEGNILVAFLSREVPGSPPTVEIHGVARTPGQIVMDAFIRGCIVGGEFDQERKKTRSEEYYEWFAQLPKLMFAGIQPPPEKPKIAGGYTFDEMWLAYHKGWDFGYARKSSLDSDALFEEFLDSLGKKSPSQAEGRELPPREPHQVHSHPKWAAFLEGSTWNSFPAPEKSAEQHFMDWLETIPADPLEEDRNLLAKVLVPRAIICHEDHLRINVSRETSTAVFNAVGRILRSEVSNG